jgi:predicted DCC family thiol-disulfide oxidoreductase YuxK
MPTTLRILFDGDCPFCKREAAWLQRLDRHKNLEFEDISAPDFDPSDYGLTDEQVQASIHGILSDSSVIEGVEVFRIASRSVGLGWLMAPTRWPGLRTAFDTAYSIFARNRNTLGNLFSRSCREGACEIKQ